MSYIDHNPRIAWAMAFETGIRTQAAADLAEAGAKVQASGAKSGGGYNDHYVPIYSVIQRMEREQPVIAAVGHWLCLNDTGQANGYIDDVADTVLTRYIASTPAWGEYRKARKARIEALVQARMMQDRLNVDGSRIPWGPADICAFVREWQGVSIVAENWHRDGYELAWRALGEILRDLEGDAMDPVAEAAYRANKRIRDERWAA